MSQAAKIRSTITSTKKTRKVTSALELVAASKLGSTQARMSQGLPFADKMLQVISHIANCQSEYKHPLLQQKVEINKVGYIVVSSDRGLCGPLNSGLFKDTLLHMQKFQENNIGVETCLFGNKAMSFFNRHNLRVTASANNLGDVPKVADIIGVVQVLLNAFSNKEVDKIFIASNTFVNTMVQKPRILQLAPLLPSTLEDSANHWDYIYEPGAVAVMEKLLTRYIECQVYQAIIENIACEQAARMIAMKNATENAGDIIDGLKLAYNKVRQASITQELSEIVAGSEAV